MSRAKKQAKTLLLVGLGYFIWPFDIPTFIDDIIVNVITVSLAGLLVFFENRANKAAQKLSTGAKQRIAQAVSNGTISKEVAAELEKTVDSAETKACTAVSEQLDKAQIVAQATVHKHSSNMKKPDAF